MGNLAEDIYALGGLMATNLNSMGISEADADEGLTALADRILDIEPSVGGLDLSTDIQLTSTSNSIYVGESVILSAKVIASYDDESLVNVDLSGVLTGATVLFKEGNNTIGTGVTDVNGIATLTLNNLSADTHTLYAVFDGTSNFDACTSSNVEVVVSHKLTLTLTSNKDILSYADSDAATLTATYEEDDVGVNGKSVLFCDANYIYRNNTDLGYEWKLVGVSMGSSSSDYITIGLLRGYNLRYVPFTRSVYLFDKNSLISSFSCGDYVEYIDEVLYGSNGDSLDISSYNIDMAKNTNRGCFAVLGEGLIDIQNTNNSGIATATYNSAGVGDVGLIAVCSSVVSETYDIKDAIKYYSGTLTTTTVISVPNLPTDFEMSWKTIRQSGKTAYMKFGLSEAHVIYGGILSAYDNTENIGIYRYVQGQGNKEGGSITGYSLPANVEKTITMRHENNVASISIDGHSKSFTNTALTSRDYVRADISGGSIKEILIMPL